MAFSVREHMEKICEYFDGSRTNGRRLILVYKFHDSGENDGIYTIRIENDTCTLEEGEAADYTTKMILTAEGYERIVTGKMMVISAFWNGAIRYIGSTLGLEELQTYLDIPKDSGIAAL